MRRVAAALAACLLASATARADQGSIQLAVGGALESATNPLFVTIPVGSPGFFNLYQVGGTAVVTGGLAGLLGVRGTDGTNLTPVMDAVTRAAFFKLTDGTNTAPTMDVAARAGFQKITDGTNTGAVKAASTAAAAADPSFVVGLSPNSPVPAGPNRMGKVGIDHTTHGTTNAEQQVAGAALAGKFGIDQTTPGTTNGVVDSQLETDLGPPGATACATDTGSCSNNALMQRIAQRLTTINSTLGTPMQTTGGTIGLVAGTAKVGIFTTDQTTPGTTDLVHAAQNGTWTVQPGNTANTTAWKVDGSAVTQPVSIATAPVLVAGSAIIGKVGIDQTTPGTTNGTSPVAAATGGYSYLHIAAGTATTVVKASAGTLHTIVFNSAATATNTTTICDNATSCSSGTIAIPAVVSVTAPETTIYDLAFANGLTIVTATANGGDMTVTYK